MTSSPNTLVTDYATYSIEDGILIAEISMEKAMTLQDAQKIVSERLEFSKGKSYPFLMIYHQFKLGDRPSREYMRTEGVKGVIAGGFVTNSAIVKNFFNFFLMVSKTPIPSKIFTSKEEAIEWLKPFRSE